MGVSIGIVINTCCLEPGAGERLSSGRRPYAERAWLLRNVILPYYTDIEDVQVVVSGSFESGEGYRYVKWPSVYRNCVDALTQRQLGLDALSDDVDWVVFQHDDHLLERRALLALPSAPSVYDADVLCPSRWTRARGQVEQLNDGRPYAPDGHINGHCVAMRPWVARRVPWVSVPPVFTWDIEYTKLLRAGGVAIQYAPELRCFDMEMGAEPWR